MPLNLVWELSEGTFRWEHVHSLSDWGNGKSMRNNLSLEFGGVMKNVEINHLPLLGMIIQLVVGFNKSWITHLQRLCPDATIQGLVLYLLEILSLLWMEKILHHRVDVLNLLHIPGFTAKDILIFLEVFRSK